MLSRLSIYQFRHCNESDSTSELKIKGVWRLMKMLLQKEILVTSILSYVKYRQEKHT